MTEFSIAIPAHDRGENGPKWMRELLDTLKQQTCQDFEVIVSDQSKNDNIMEACQDYDFDVRNNLYSLPQRFGVRSAMNFAKLMHVLTIISFVSLGILLDINPIYHLGCTIAAVLLIYEHRLVSPTDLTKIDVAFFNINGYIAVVLFICTLAAVYV